MSSRVCKLHPNRFCYVCGKIVQLNRGFPITKPLQEAYLHYFGFPVSNQDKNWVPHVICTNCRLVLSSWYSGKNRSLKFGKPMIWREPTNHVTDCYFCLTKTFGFNSKNKDSIKYADVPSVTKPVLHSEDLPVPTPPGRSDQTHTDTSSSVTMHQSSDSEKSSSDNFVDDENSPHLITQSELNDLIRDLHLSKSKAELLASRLQQWNLLDPSTKVSIYRYRSKAYANFFTKENEFCYCHDVKGLFEEMKQPYDPKEWRLFIDSSKESLKAVLLHNGNTKPSIPIGHAVNCKETYDTMAKVIELIKYECHNWYICGDLKVIGMLLGLQGGYTKYCCFLCLWDSRAKQDHYKRKIWPVRNEYVPGKMNVKNTCLVDPQKIILPPLHIKLGLMKNFIKALDKTKPAFQYLCTVFTNLSEAKLKEGIFVGPQIRKILDDTKFESLLTEVEKAAWNSFKSVVRNFLGNKKSDNYKEIVENLLQNYERMGVNMSLKIHFLHSHLDFFPENLGGMSDEHGERFHQDLKSFEQNYQGFWDQNMLGDYCWSVVRDTDENIYKKRAKITHF